MCTYTDNFIQGGAIATGEAMGYFAIPGISGLDLFSGTVFVSTDSTTAQTVNGVVLGIVYKV